MKTLENLVPPWDLCKQIPEGQFADSSLAWDSDYETRFVRPRIEVEPLIAIPAPTLEEIMERMWYRPDIERIGMWEGDRWIVQIVMTNGMTLREYDVSSVTAALRLWIRYSHMASSPAN